MPTCRAGSIDIFYEALGDTGAPTMLLIRGHGGQLLAWDDDWCERLVSCGFRVVRFDNRDVGWSSKLESYTPDVVGTLAALLEGRPPPTPYLIDDMADDAAALVAAVSGGPAHVFGISLGGMIAQSLAIRYPRLVASLCSAMSTTGAPGVGATDPDALLALAATDADPESAEAAGDNDVAVYRIIGSPGFPLDEDRIRRVAEASFRRCHCPEGAQRQLMALLASPDRTEGLRGVTAPTLVIHGEADPLIQSSGGEATAQAVVGSRLVMVPGMGHDLPPPVRPRLAEEIVANAKRGGFSER